MSNFSPKLEDATEKELRYMVNELDFRVVHLASDELTRRYLDQLQKTIEESNKNSEKLEIANYKLQMVMVMLTVVTTLVVLFPVLKFIFKWITVTFSGSFQFLVISNQDIEFLSGILSGLIVGIATLNLMKARGFWFKN